MKLPQLLHSTRSYGRANSAFSLKLPGLEREFLSCRPKSSRDRSEKDACFGSSPVGAPRKSPFIWYSRLAEDWLQRSGSSSTISPTTLFSAISARGQRNCLRSSIRRGSREYGIASITGVSGPSFGFSGGFVRWYPGGTENRHILAIVSRLSPNTPAASRRLCPSSSTYRRTAAYTST